MLCGDCYGNQVCIHLVTVNRCCQTMAAHINSERASAFCTNSTPPNSSPALYPSRSPWRILYPAPVIALASVPLSWEITSAISAGCLYAAVIKTSAADPGRWGWFCLFFCMILIPSLSEFSLVIRLLLLIAPSSGFFGKPVAGN